MERRTLLVSDLDGTLLGDDDALERFAQWRRARGPALRLAYATGRFFDSVAALVASTALPAPDAVLGAVGTEIAWYPSGEPASGWPPAAAAWDREAVQRLLAGLPGLRPQPAAVQSPRKLSYYAPDLDEEALARIRRLLRDAGRPAEVVYSSNRDLDLLPPGVNKGTAVRWLASHWGFRDDEVVVAGDTGNDAAMFRAGFRGIVVANAQPELRSLRGPAIYHSDRAFAAGVLDGLQYWLSGEAAAGERLTPPRRRRSPALSGDSGTP